MSDGVVNGEPGWALILEYGVQGPNGQEALVRGLSGLVSAGLREVDGYLYSRFHLSTDGRRVVHTMNWRSEEDAARFQATTDGAARVAALQELFARVPGGVEAAPFGGPPPSYRVRTLVPSLQPA